MAAPAAHFDDDWPALGDADAVSERRLLTLKGRAAAAEEKDAAAAPRHHPDDEDIFALHECRLSPGKSGAFKATEDPANGLDEKLSACFQNVPAGSDSIAPASPIEEDSLLEKDAIWNALTSNYGRVMPVDWKQSRTCSLHIPALSLEQKLREKDVTAELPDDEELREQLDMHSIIVTCLAEEPIFTAEQVIEEIEEMMQDSDMEAEQNPSQSDLSMTSVDTQRAASSPSFERRVRSLSVAELNERLEGTEMSIRSLSDELVQQLALRDELDFEKEVKNSFISALIDVQNRQKEHRELQKKKKKLKGGGGAPLEQGKRALGSRFSVEGLSSAIQNSFRQTFGSGCREKQYLTTVIPYEKKGHPPSLDDLQILTKILEAMRDDSEKVPSLLTDYILKVLCPT